MKFERTLSIREKIEWRRRIEGWRTDSGAEARSKLEGRRTDSGAEARSKLGKMSMERKGKCGKESVLCLVEN